MIADLREKGNTQASRVLWWHWTLIQADFSLASYPAFNPNTFFQDYNEIQADPDKPKLTRLSRALIR